MIGSFGEGIVDGIMEDAPYMALSVILIFSYLIIFIGSCSPIHMRLVVSLVGILCIILAYVTGLAIGFYTGGKASAAHNTIPYMLMGIGVDDMFVVCNALD